MTRPERRFEVNSTAAPCAISHAACRIPNANNANRVDPLPGASSLPPLPLPPDMSTRPERRWEVYGPRTEWFTPAHAHASMAAPQSTDQQQASAAAAPASYLPVRLSTAAAPPLMPTRASANNLLLGPAPAPACSSTAAPAGVSNFQMDRMLVAVDGANEKDDQEGDHISQVSIGSSVSSSSGTGSRPKIRAMSPEEVTSMDISLQDKILKMKIRQLQQMARECGADESDPDLWLGLMEMIHSECATRFFMESDPIVRLAIIKHYAKLHDQRMGKTLLKWDGESADDSEKEFDEEYFNTFLDNNAAGFR